jgi:uncharacterized protein YdhG (YjbR/CyaY superfamily)
VCAGKVANFLHLLVVYVQSQIHIFSVEKTSLLRKENRLLNKYLFLESTVMKPKKAFETIDEYIATFPKEVQVVLEELRRVIMESAPEAEEAIRYQMPTFRLNGNLVHFAAHKNHIGFYPTPSAIERFTEKLSAFKTSKGAVQFPLAEPIPFALVKEMVRFRVKENMSKNKQWLKYS